MSARAGETSRQSELFARDQPWLSRIRYCDDFVMCFEHEDDARRVMTVLSKRMARSWVDSREPR